MRRVSDEKLLELRTTWGVDERSYLSLGIVPDLLADRADDISQQAADAARIAELEAELAQEKSLRQGAVAHHGGLVDRLRIIFDAFFGKPDTQERANATEFDVVQALRKLKAKLDLAETNLACTADVLNTWCRESGSPECKNPYGELTLRSTLDYLWGKVSGKHEMEKRLLYEKIEKLQRDNSDLRRLVDHQRPGPVSIDTSFIAYLDCGPGETGWVLFVRDEEAFEMVRSKLYHADPLEALRELDAMRAGK